MKHSSAILLWTSIVLSLVFALGFLFFCWQVARVYYDQVLPPDVWQELERQGIHPGDARIGTTLSDIRSGMVLHLRPLALLWTLLPALGWGFLYFADRPALNTRLGRISTWIVLLSLVLILVSFLWLRHAVTMV